MKTFLYRIFPAVLLATVSLQGYAADPLEEYFYASGKYKVVIAVVAIVLAGIFVHLFSLDRRLKKMENRNQEK